MRKEITLLSVLFGVVMLVANLAIHDHYENTNSQLNHELKQEKETFKEILSRKDFDLKVLNEKVNQLEKDINLLNFNK